MADVRRLRTVLGCCIGLSLVISAMHAAPILSGTVTQNGSLYTYSYVLDNTSGPGPIDELSILVNTLTSDTFTMPQPVNVTTPPDWAFHVKFSGSIGDPPYNEFGEFYTWDTDNGVNIPGSVYLPAGQTLSGFSFTTTYAPANDGNNYFLFCPTDCGAFGGGQINSGVVEYGHIVAPDFLISTPPPFSSVPEPNFFWPVLLVASGVLVKAARIGRGKLFRT